MQSALKKVNFAIAGSGNVASRLVDAFVSANQKPECIVSRSQKGQILAQSFDIPFFNNPEDAPSVDIWLLCINDDALNSNYPSRFPAQSLVCHTAGSVALNVLNLHSRSGVFYPLQTLSKDKKLSFENIPICIEAGKQNDLELLQALASTISNDVRKLNSEQRLTTHLAAVFVSNFVNYCYRIGYDILTSKGVDFNILAPLIEETAFKTRYLNPHQAQTGPAQRGDQLVMQKHLELLTQWPEFQNIYKIISHEIERNQ